MEARSIVDREEDLAAIASLLADDEVRLLTLTGPAGVGKTRLAREVGRTVAPRFPEGVVFVDLSLVRDPALVVPTLAREVGVADTSGPPLLDRLRDYLSDREMLLILDNLEQVLPADVGLGELLLAAPRLVVLATSREPLHLIWEQLYHVPPLALPDPEHLPPLQELSGIPSVTLFLSRAQMIDPGFQLTDKNAGAIAELMVGLDGLPLAINLAAARIQVLSPQMLLQRLSRRLSLLHWTGRDLPERQHTLRAAIAWSYDNLSPQEQALFCSLGAFVGGFTLEAAETLTAEVAPQTIDALEGLSSLVDKSLVQREDDGQGGYRFRMLESVRDFALERLIEADRLDTAKHSQAEYYLALAERAEPELTGPRQRTWFILLEGTQDNLRAALAWMLDRDSEAALRLAVALAHFWEIRGHLAEGRRWIEAALARASTAAPSLRARALVWLGAILVLSVDQTGANAIDQAAHAEEVLTEGMNIARTTGDSVSVARALTHLGVLTLQTGDWERGKGLLEEAQIALRETGHDREVIQALLPRGVIAYLQGQQEEAAQLMDEILGRYRDVGDDFGLGVALLFSMTVVATQGEVLRAVGIGEELLALTIQSQSDRLMHISAAGIAWLARNRGHPERLARLVSAAESMYQAVGLVSSVMQRVYVGPTREVLQARIGHEELEAAVRAGRHLSFQQVAALLRDVLEEVVPEDTQLEPERVKDPAGILSPREREVLQRIAEGLSNKQIAHDMIIAESTVRYHLTSIFNKLGVDTRTHALAVAAQRGIIQLGSPP